MNFRKGAAAIACVVALGAASAVAAPGFDQGRLLMTGGVSQAEGAGGGGLVPWALITGYGSRDGLGATAYVTIAVLPDVELTSFGAGLGLFDRLELTYGRQELDTKDAGGDLGIGDGFTFGQDIFGAKLRLVGNAVYDQDRWLPQISLGIQHKVADHAALLEALGAKDNEGTDYYLAATKLLLAESLLVNVTTRMTRANQFGLLGFGGDRNDDYRPEVEASLVHLLRHDLALGLDARTKPDNLGFATEDDAFDVFVAVFPSKSLSLTAAFLDAGRVARQGDQAGLYLSLQAGF